MNVTGRSTTNAYARRNFYSGFRAWGRPKSEEFLDVALVKEMGNPGGHVVIDEEAARTTEKRYTTLEVEL